MDRYCFTPVAYVESPFTEKFGVPRQSGLIADARGALRFVPPYNVPEAFDGLAGCSHLWLLFVFHQNPHRGWKPRVRPPRMGGNRRLGVFASRSGFRPNPVGLSVVRLEELHCSKGDCSLQVAGLDLVDGTPVLDVKPYLPYADAIASATNRFAPAAPRRVLSVVFSAEVRQQLHQQHPDGALRRLIEDALALDPRPAYRQGEVAGEYAMKLMHLDVRWRMQGADQAEVFSICRVNASPS
jgi:tRNA-Thr(GGU) m(6)t(6)A37 methyltransferase TsaA